MDGQSDAPHSIECAADGAGISAEFARRVAAADNQRLAQAVKAAVQSVHALVDELRPNAAEFRAVVDFLTETGHHADVRRQEWVLLADVIGLSSSVDALNNQRPDGATPNTVAGPFYRPDAPEVPLGANLSRDGKGVPLSVTGRIVDLDGAPIADAQLEVWHANSEGRYENQKPDLQPEHNLRGRFCTDLRGKFWFSTVMPGGYSLPSDGPVGHLMLALGLCLDRPAHVHFRVEAKGHETLTTHIYDRADATICRDAIFGVKPELMADFPTTPPSGKPERRSLDVALVLCPLGSDQPGIREEKTLP